jgi:hypothetical protein
MALRAMGGGVAMASRAPRRPPRPPKRLERASPKPGTLRLVAEALKPGMVRDGRRLISRPSKPGMEIGIKIPALFAVTGTRVFVVVAVVVVVVGTVKVV